MQSMRKNTNKRTVKHTYIISNGFEAYAKQTHLMWYACTGSIVMDIVEEYLELTRTVLWLHSVMCNNSHCWNLKTCRSVCRPWFNSSKSCGTGYLRTAFRYLALLLLFDVYSFQRSLYPRFSIYEAEPETVGWCQWRWPIQSSPCFLGMAETSEMEKYVTTTIWEPWSSTLYVRHEVFTFLLVYVVHVVRASKGRCATLRCEPGKSKLLGQMANVFAIWCVACHAMRCVMLLLLEMQYHEDGYNVPLWLSALQGQIYWPWWCDLACQQPNVMAKCILMRRWQSIGALFGIHLGSNNIRFSLLQPLGLFSHTSNWVHLFSQDCDLTKTIPLVIHGDDAESHRRRSFTICTFGSVLVTGKCLWDSKILLYALDGARANETTLATLDKWVSWSLLECQLGHFMDQNPWGEDFAPFTAGRSGRIMGEYKAVLAIHKGDEKYLQKCYKSSHAGNSTNVCMQCMANAKRGNLIYTSHGLQAHHRSTRLETTDFITRVCGVHTWVALPGWSPQVISHDWLHITDLSLIPEASASALLELIDEKVFGDGSVDEKLRKAHVIFVRACRNFRIRTLAWNKWNVTECWSWTLSGNRGQIFAKWLSCTFYFGNIFDHSSVENHRGNFYIHLGPILTQLLRRSTWMVQHLGWTVCDVSVCLNGFTHQPLLLRVVISGSCGFGQMAKDRVSGSCILESFKRACCAAWLITIVCLLVHTCDIDGFQA